MRTSTRRLRTGLIDAAVCAVLALGLVACESTDSAGGGRTTDAQLAAAAAAVTTAKKVPQWTAPGAAIDVKKLRGKSIYVIPITSQSAFEAQVEAAQKQVAAAAGVNLTFYTNKGSVAEWVQGMDAAIAARPDLIFLQSAPDPRQLQPQLAAAKKAGIPVVASHIWDSNDPDAPNCAGCTGLTAIVKGPFAQAGQMMANWAINDSKGAADVLLVGIDGLNSSDVVVKSAESEFQKNCSGCKVKTISLPLDQISDGAIQAVSSALVGDPGITYVVPAFDILISGSVASMNTSNRESGTKVVSFGGTSSAMQALADSRSPVAADVAEPITWTAYANMDQSFRVLAGVSPGRVQTPARLFDESNVSEAGSPPDFTPGFGADYESGFMKLWNLEN